MSFLNDFKNAGGRVTGGSDSGFIYRAYSWLHPRVRDVAEAGFHPLGCGPRPERRATLSEPKETVDFIAVRAAGGHVIVNQNPLETSISTPPAPWLNGKTARRRVGGVKCYNQGRHRLRCQETRRRCGGDGQRAKRQTGDDGEPRLRIPMRTVGKIILFLVLVVVVAGAGLAISLHFQRAGGG